MHSYSEESNIGWYVRNSIERLLEAVQSAGSVDAGELCETRGIQKEYCGEVFVRKPLDIICYFICVRYERAIKILSLIFVS